MKRSKKMGNKKMSKNAVKKAVIVLGYSNNGKTKTILNCINRYEVSNRATPRVKVMNQLYNFQQNKNVFIQGQSPSESKTSLATLLNGQRPDYLIVAEQINGALLSNTRAFLQRNNYQFTEFRIANPANPSPIHWNYDKNGLPPQRILEQRADDIFNAL